MNDFDVLGRGFFAALLAFLSAVPKDEIPQEWLTWLGANKGRLGGTVVRAAMTDAMELIDARQQESE